jgi:hypothetical protein
VCAPPSTVLIAPADTTIELRVLADGNVVEAFFQGGRTTLLARSSPAAQKPGAVSATGARQQPESKGHLIEAPCSPCASDCQRCGCPRRLNQMVVCGTAGATSPGEGVRLVQGSAWAMKDMWVTREQLLPAA